MFSLSFTKMKWKALNLELVVETQLHFIITVEVEFFEKAVSWTVRQGHKMWIHFHQARIQRLWLNEIVTRNENVLNTPAFSKKSS